MPSGRVWNSGGPPSTRLAAMVSPPLLLELLPLAPLLPDWPHAVSAVSRTVAPVSARTILGRAILWFMDVLLGSAAARVTPRWGPGGGCHAGTARGSGGRGLLGGGQLGERSRAAVGAAGEPPRHAA